MSEHIGLVELVDRERREEPILITPEIDPLVERMNYSDLRSFVVFNRETKGIEESGIMDHRDLRECYARRLLAALYLAGNAHPTDQRSLARIAYDTAGTNASVLAKVSETERNAWLLRALVTKSRSGRIGLDQDMRQNAVFSFIYGSLNGLRLLEVLGNGSSLGDLSSFGWDYDKILREVGGCVARSQELYEESVAIKPKLAGVYGEVIKRARGFLMIRS